MRPRLSEGLDPVSCTRRGRRWRGTIRWATVRAGLSPQGWSDATYARTGRSRAGRAALGLAGMPARADRRRRPGGDRGLYRHGHPRDLGGSCAPGRTGSAGTARSGPANLAASASRRALLLAAGLGRAGLHPLSVGMASSSRRRCDPRHGPAPRVQPPCSAASRLRLHSRRPNLSLGQLQLGILRKLGRRIGNAGACRRHERHRSEDSGTPTSATLPYFSGSHREAALRRRSASRKTS